MKKKKLSKDGREIFPWSFQECPKFRWFDYRFIKPSSNSFDYYLVIEGSRSIIVRVAGYKPKNQYTDGEFVSVNNTDCSIDKYVKFWAPLPSIPKQINDLCCLKFADRMGD